MPKHESMVVFRSQVEKRKKFAFKRLIVVVSVVLGIAGLWTLWIYSEPMNLFTLQHIHVLGNHRVDAADVRKTMGLRNGTGLFVVDLRNLERKIEKMTWVRSAKVTRSLPDMLNVEIEEFNPTAVLMTDRPYLVSSEGHLLPPAPSGYVVNLPVITNYVGTLPKYGQKVPDMQFIQAVAVLAEMKQYKLFARISEIRFVNPYQYRLFMDDGRIELMIGKKHRESICAVDNFLKRIPATVNWADVAYIDARTPGFVALNNQPLQSVLTQVEQQPLPDRKSNRKT